MTAPPKKRKAIRLRTALLAGAVVLLPVVFADVWYLLPPLGPPPEVVRPPSRFPASPLRFGCTYFTQQQDHAPLTTHVQIADLDGDGRPDILACDARLGRVFWYRNLGKQDQFAEHVLNPDRELPAPGHATVIDLDGDKDQDVIVSVLGNLWPTDERIGRVVWLENRGGTFTAHTLLTDVRRVTDVQGGDFDGDGDIDLVVAVFGYDRGQILYLENNGTNRFREHELAAVPGTIHVPVADFDGDGDLDVAAVVSQDEEEVLAFENIGGKPVPFRQRQVWFTYNFDLGSAGLVACDLDKDGDTDLLLAAGDNFELIHNYPQPWHGCYWLENRGGWNFVARRIAALGGTYAAAAGDLDGDGDLDVVLVSQFHDWRQKDAASVVWLENDGRQNFRTWQIANGMIRLATVACADLNGDGRAEIVAGLFHLHPPTHPASSLYLWTNSTRFAPYAVDPKNPDK